MWSEFPPIFPLKYFRNPIPTWSQDSILTGVGGAQLVKANTCKNQYPSDSDDVTKLNH